MIFAHSVEGRSVNEWETLEAHSRRVAKAAARRAEPFGMVPAAEALGLLHDLGKAKPAFQKRLGGSEEAVPHSGEGALALSRMGTFGGMLAGAIAGHHGRLPNLDRLTVRLAEAEAIPLPGWLSLPVMSPPSRLVEADVCREALAFRAQFLTRLLYSCLTDADDRETASFYDEANEAAPLPRTSELTPEMRNAFDRHMARLDGTGPVNALRAEVLAHVRAQAGQRPGTFTLTVPTGGGKTLASLGFALDHAAAHGLRRLVYVIPFTSIVEQTADVFRRVLGADAVLEHHAAFDWNGVDESEAEQRRMGAASWDVPVVVTTAVQFFESLFAARKKRCRKLHSLARSVIVLDEAQTLPRGFLRPCLAALNELVDGYGVSVVLCTATQPTLTRAAGFPAPEALDDVRELAPNPPELYDRLRRVRVRDLGEQDDEALAGRMRAAERALLIVDNRVQARGLFERLRDAEGVAHLSTLMTAAHRRAVLADVRARLTDKQPVRLVSTSLVEAGVDVDFPLVLRAAAGVASLAQAAGRCNREGTMKELGELLVFRSTHPAPPVVEDNAAKGRDVLARFPDPLSLEAVAEYFALLWRGYGTAGLDVAKVGGVAGGILAAIGRGGLACPFEDVEEAFRLIEQEQLAVVVRSGAHGVSELELDVLRWQRPGAVARAFQPYAINVPRSVWRKLWDARAVAWWKRDRFGEQFAMLMGDHLYDPAAGLAVDGFEELGTLIV